ncbi:MAG: DNA-binding protein [Allorhizobium sp.]
MALTRDFTDTIKARVTADPAFRSGLLSQAVDLLLSGDIETGKGILRDYINATIGFSALGSAADIPPKSLMRMFGPKGNPRADSIFKVISVLQEKTDVQLAVGVAA